MKTKFYWLPKTLGSTTHWLNYATVVLNDGKELCFLEDYEDMEMLCGTQ